MAHPPPPPPPPPGYGGPPPGYGGPPPGYGAPPGGGFGAPPPPPGAGGPGAQGGGRSNGPLVALMAALVVVVVLIVVGALVLVSRGGDEDVELTEPQLEAALVEVDVVGAGFTVSEDDDDDGDDEFDRDEVDASEECIDLYEKVASLSVGVDGDVPEAARSFTRDDNAEVSVTLSGPTEVTLDDVRAIVTTCEEIAVDDGEASGTLRFSELDDVPEVGDERAGVRIDVELEVPFAITVQSATVLWVRDGTQADVSVTGAVDEDTFEGQEPDLALLRTVAEAQDEALEQAIDEAG